MTAVRVSRRELALLCRYVLVQANLPDGLVVTGGRLVAAAELWMGTGLCWLRDNLDALRTSGPAPIATSLAPPRGEVMADGQSMLPAGIVALDLATIGAQGGALADVRVVGATGTDLAPALVVLAAQRGLSAMTMGDRAGMAGTWVAVGGPASPFGWLTDSRPSGQEGVVHLSATMVTPRTAPRPAAIRPGTEDGIDVDGDLWVRLLDAVGGTLPPDGRGRLTIADDRLMHDAGPGAGRLHDDD